MTMQLQRLTLRVLSSRVLRSAFGIYSGRWMNLLLSVLTSAVTARILGIDNVGLVTLAISSVSIVVQFIDVRTSEALIRFVGNALARDERDEAATFFRIGVWVDIVVAVAAFLIVLLIVPLFLRSYPQSDRILPLMYVYLLTAPATILQNTFESTFTIVRRFDIQIALDIGIAVFSAIVLIVLAFQGITVFIWGYVVVSIVNLLITSTISLRLLRQKLAGTRVMLFNQRLREFLPFAFHTSAMGSLKAFALHLDTLLLGAFRSPAEVAIFDKAMGAISLVAMPIAPLNNVIYPMLNEAWAKDDKRRLRYLTRRYLLTAGAITALSLVFYFLIADFMIYILFGSEFAPAAFLIRIMLLGVGLEMQMGWVRTMALVAGKPQLVTLTGILSFIGRFGLLAVLISPLGAAGSAIAYIFGVIVSVLANVVLVLPRLGLGSYPETIKQGA
jgi:O-antigen/teichoic acid export membrane protein